MKLCCIFNYPPAYRASIYQKIDEHFDTKFYFAEELEVGKPCDIKKLDYSIFKKEVGRIENKKFIKWGWKSGIQILPYKKYDAFLITADADLSYIPFLIACKLLHKKVIAWGHGPKSWCWKNFGIDRLFVRLTTYYLTYSEGSRNRMIELGVPAIKLGVIYNSLCDYVDPELRRVSVSDEVMNYFNNNYPTVLFIGRLTKVKKLDWLIDAILKHNNEGILYNLLIIGDGIEYEHLVKRALKTGISERIWFYGECYDANKLNSLIYNSDLCVSPGNVGLTALHSMMYGTPVLSHDDFTTQMPEYETIVNGKTGLLYKKGDFNDFCSKITLWLSNHPNREDIRANCYEMINMKWNSNYQISLLKELLK